MAKTLLDILAKKGVLREETTPLVEKEQKENGASMEEALIRYGVLERDIADAKADLTGFPVRTLEGSTLPQEVLRDIPEESARHYGVIPLGRKEGYLEVGMRDPQDAAAQAAVKFIATRINLPLKIYIITQSDFDKVMRQYKNLMGEVSQVLGEFQKEYETLGEDVKIKRSETTRIVEEAPVTKMFAVILRHAVEGKASDIHIEPTRENVRVRFRVDGALHTSLMLPADVQSAIATRIKVMTNLKIDETRIPQDGRFHAEIIGKEIDFRVSTFPTSFGEKVVIRILDPSTGVQTLPELGLTGRNLELIETNMTRPYGLILITGPTGSGKSTTLYTMLQKLNQERSNIVSLEDPVEYYINGISQSQIHPEIGYDFATGLRHILRQDPDIIMVGEIRDKETAALAIHAALTGHLVLSTLHTNNALGVIPRLIDMGVDPYLIPTTLVLAIGQRLVRKLCPDSRKKVKLSGHAKEIIAKETDAMPSAIRDQAKKKISSEIYQPEVSTLCPKGTRGRIGVFETIAMTPELEKIILSGPSEAKIAEEAKRQDMITMKQDGIMKVLDGIIGLEELLEVI